jgi:hypothetical protein
MAEMSWSHAGAARATLRSIVSDPDYGPGALSSPRIMANLLNDYLPDAPREKVLLLAAVEAGTAESLSEHVSAGLDPATAIGLTASSLASRTAIEPDACAWAATEFAVALGLISEAAAAELGARPGTPDPGPAGNAPVTRVPGAAAPGPAGQAVDQDSPSSSTLAPGPVPAPTSPTAVLPASSGLAGPGATTGPGRRRIRIALVSAVAGVAGVAVAIWASGVLGSPVQPLSSIIAPFATSCGSAHQSFTLGGVTSSYLCVRTTATGVDVLAYQFDNSADYQAGLTSLNIRTGFLAAGASRSCPPASGTAFGSVSWHSTRSAKYPPLAGQILECYTDSHNHLPLIVWTLPRQRAILLADDGASGAKLADLSTWWTAIGFG